MIEDKGSLLSQREQEVLRWLALGKSGSEISMILGISVSTVRVHIRMLISKLGASNIPHAVMRAVQSGVLRTSEPQQQQQRPNSL